MPECDDKSSGPVGRCNCVKGPSSGVGGQVLLAVLKQWLGGKVLLKRGEGGCDCDNGSCNCIEGLSPNIASWCASMTSPCTKRHRAP